MNWFSLHIEPPSYISFKGRSYLSSIDTLNIESPETTWPIELKFHMKTRYDRLAKIYTNHTGHMAKMATTPIYGKSPLNIFFSGTKRPMPLGLGM